jgi:hypothetical protein
MDKPTEPEILGPEDPKPYDDPSLTSKDFLRAVYTCSRLPMSTRIEAAKAAAAYEHPRLQQVASDITAGVRMIIEGGLPALPGTNVIMPETEGGQKRTTNGSGNPES